jgi:HD superfamily phosphodiesterase
VRVWKTAFQIQAKEGGNRKVFAAAVLLHDCVPVSKKSSRRAHASRLAAAKASKILCKLGWTDAGCRQLLSINSRFVNLAPGVAQPATRARTGRSSTTVIEGHPQLSRWDSMRPKPRIGLRSNGIPARFGG